MFDLLNSIRLSRALEGLKGERAELAANASDWR